MKLGFHRSSEDSAGPLPPRETMSVTRRQSTTLVLKLISSLKTCKQEVFNRLPVPVTATPLHPWVPIPRLLVPCWSVAVPRRVHPSSPSTRSVLPYPPRVLVGPRSRPLLHPPPSPYTFPEDWYRMSPEPRPPGPQHLSHFPSQPGYKGLPSHLCLREPGTRRKRQKCHLCQEFGLTLPKLRTYPLHQDRHI